MARPQNIDAYPKKNTTRAFRDQKNGWVYVYFVERDLLADFTYTNVKHHLMGKVRKEDVQAYKNGNNSLLRKTDTKYS